MIHLTHGVLRTITIETHKIAPVMAGNLIASHLNIMSTCSRNIFWSYKSIQCSET